jgi:hypothetical protein
MARVRFARPRWGWFFLLDGGIAILSLLALSRRSYEAVAEPVRLPPQSALKGLLAATAVIHVAEARHAGRVARRHGLPALPWMAQTLAVGFPSLLALRGLTAAT